MNPLEIVALNRARTTFQRVSDAKFFNGWVKRISSEQVVAHTCTGSVLASGEQFSFQVYGYRKDAFFHATLTAVHGSSHGPFFSTERNSGVASLELDCNLTTDIELKEGRQAPRFCVEGVIADIVLDAYHRTEGALVVDIGPGGFAVLTERWLHKGDLVNVMLYANGFVIQCEAEVRNCMANALNDHYQRTGLQIRGLSRVDASRWTQLYKAIIETNALQLSLRGDQLGTLVKRIQKAA